MPVVSYLGPAAAFVVTGSLVVETVFGLPGTGRYLVQGAINRDYPLVMGMIVVYGTAHPGAATCSSTCSTAGSTRACAMAEGSAGALWNLAGRRLGARRAARFAADRARPHRARGARGPALESLGL